MIDYKALWHRLYLYLTEQLEQEELTDPDGEKYWMLNDIMDLMLSMDTEDER